jgi:hypothetical protein
MASKGFHTLIVALVSVSTLALLITLPVSNIGGVYSQALIDDDPLQPTSASGAAQTIVLLPLIRGSSTTAQLTPTVPPPSPTVTSSPTVSPSPTVPPPANWWRPTPDQPIHWHWQLSETFVYPRDVRPNVTVYDIDGELTSAETVAQLHALGPQVKVICYFDAGVYEDYRSDAARFPASVIGKADVGWEGSYWLDIRQTDILLPIMRDRMQHWCKDKGFDAIEPDETEVWSNDPGFPITKAENNAYNIQLAAMAHELGLSIGLKGNTSETPELWPYFDWTLNEQCWQYTECDNIKNSFIVNGKAAFNIEYEVDPDCATANEWHMNSARRDLNLVGPIHADYEYAPCVPDDQNSWE